MMRPDIVGIYESSAWASYPSISFSSVVVVSLEWGDAIWYTLKMSQVFYQRQWRWGRPEREEGVKISNKDNEKIVNYSTLESQEVEERERVPLVEQTSKEQGIVDEWTTNNKPVTLRAAWEWSNKNGNRRLLRGSGPPSPSNTSDCVRSDRFICPFKMLHSRWLALSVCSFPPRSGVCCLLYTSR